MNDPQELLRSKEDDRARVRMEIEFLLIRADAGQTNETQASPGMTIVREWSSMATMRVRSIDERVIDPTVHCGLESSPKPRKLKTLASSRR